MRWAEALAAFDELVALDSATRQSRLGREASVPLLRAWPGYDPLREDPRFQQLLVRFAAAQ